MPRTRRTRYLILGCLTVRPMSGYDIKRFVDRSIVHFWSESYGQLYPTLARLEEEGAIEGRVEQGERGPARKVYRITERGRGELEAWLMEPARPVVPRYEHSLKLFFGANVPPAVSLEHVVRLREQTAQALTDYRRMEVELEGMASRDPNAHAPYWMVVLRGGIHYSEMVLRWCEESEARLRALPGAGDARSEEGRMAWAE